MTLNNFEWQLKLFKETPAPPLAELMEVAHADARLEYATAAIVLGFSVLGFLLLWGLGIRGGGGEH